MAKAHPALTPHPDFARIERAIDRIVFRGGFVRWKGDVYRFAHPKYAGPTDFISGKGAKLKGGRWNPPFGPPTLYAASSPQLATEETFATAWKLGFAPRRLLPRIIKAIHVQVSHLVDVTDGDIRKSLMVSKERMLAADWQKENSKGREALPQAIGRAAAEAGVEGLIVPSAEWPEDFNLVLFMNNLKGGSNVAVVT